MNTTIGILEQKIPREPVYYYSLGHNMSYNSEMQNYVNAHIYTPTLITGKTWQFIHHGYLTAYGIRADGTMWTSGYGGYGQTGRGTDTAYNTIAQSLSSSNWKEISGGAYMSYHLKNDGTLWFLGRNENCESGNNNLTSPITSIIQIGSDTNWASVTGAFDNACAIKNNGTLWSWGMNSNYQCGLGHTTSPVMTPTQIGTDNDWVSVSGGNNWIAIKKNGTAWTWGRSLSYGTGQNTLTDIQIPTRLGTFTNVKVATGTIEVCALVTTDGKLYTWGRSIFHGTGQNTLTDIKIPTQVGTDSDWSDVIIGYYSGFALKTNGTLWSWGQSPACGQNSEQSVPTQIGTDSDWKSFGRNGCYSLGAFITKSYH